MSAHHPRLLKRVTVMLAGAALSGCSVTTNQYGPGPKATAAAPQTAQEALRPYYAALDQKLPKAPPGPILNQNEVITRFAFGACVNENRNMAFWDVIAAQNPQAFLLIGDNVYGDTRGTNSADIPTLSASYRKLASRQEFFRFRQSVPMMTTWDDHDLGANDAGGTFAFKEYAEKIYESFWNASGDVKSRPGVYESQIVGPVGKRVQFILLDTRYFRSDLVQLPYRDPPPTLGWNIPNTDSAATILGDAQWAWLAGELAKPAELRFIISSVQLVTSAHGYESWANFPKERDRFYRLLAGKGVNNAVLLTGDRHAGAFYRTDVSGVKKPLYEFTSTSLNFAFGKGDNGDKEPDTSRLGGLWAVENFGQIDIDWTKKAVKMTLKSSDNTLIEERTIRPFD